jgi:uncharacterized protein YqgC (DUF456 family)
MDQVWIIIGIILMVVGIIGNIVPMLPGTPLCYLALLLQQFREPRPFSTTFLLVWGLVTLAVVLIDYLVPIYGTKKWGGTRYGIWGCTLGLFAGFFFGPMGVVLGPFVGAFIGEMIASKDSTVAMKAAIGAFMGFVFGTVIKLIASGLMAWQLGNVVMR